VLALLLRRTPNDIFVFNSMLDVRCSMFIFVKQKGLLSSKKKGALCHQALLSSLPVVFWLPRLSNDLPVRFEPGSDHSSWKGSFSTWGKGGVTAAGPPRN